MSEEAVEIETKNPRKVYSYGIRSSNRWHRGSPEKYLSSEVKTAIEEQLLLAHRYRFALWQLSMAGRTLYREQRKHHLPELAAVEDELSRYVELLKLIQDRDAGEAEKRAFKEEQQAAKVEVQRLKARAKELREAAKGHPGLAADVAAAKERNGILLRALRNVFSRVYGLYSGTYLHVEAAARSANGGTDDPAMPRWRRTGALAIQLQGGRTTKEIMGGHDPSIFVEAPYHTKTSKRDDRRLTWVKYRLKSTPDGKPVTIRIPVVFHRNLPADGKATWVKLVVSRTGDRFIYSVQFTVESALNARTEFGAGEVAVCLHNDEVWYGGEFEKPKRFAYVTRMRKADDLQSIRDKHRNSAIGLLVGWCDRQDDTAEWVRDEIAIIEERKSCRRLVTLIRRLKGVVDARVMSELKKWEYKENHLYAWQSDLRRNALMARKYAYRQFACELRRKYRTLVIDSRRLDSEERLTEERRWLGLHELRLAIQQSFGPDCTHTASGKTTDEMFEQFRDTQRLATARTAENTNDSTPVKKAKHVKRTGFERVHKAGKEAARNPTANVAE